MIQHLTTSNQSTENYRVLYKYSLTISDLLFCVYIFVLKSKREKEKESERKNLFNTFFTSFVSIVLFRTKCVGRHECVFIYRLRFFSTPDDFFLCFQMWNSLSLSLHCGRFLQTMAHILNTLSIRFDGWIEHCFEWERKKTLHQSNILKLLMEKYTEREKPKFREVITKKN